MEIMWIFRTKRFVVTWAIEPDPDTDTSFDETGETAAKVASGEWTAFMSKVTVTLDGKEVGADYLGESIYADPSTFRNHIGSKGAHGSYFVDMVKTAIDQARNYVHQEPPYIRANAHS